MSDTLLAEGIPVSTDPPAPEPQTQTAGPQEPPAPPNGADGGGEPMPILETAFIVYMNPQGHWMVAADLHTAAEMQIARPPNVDDFFHGCSTVLRDIAVQETAATAVAMQQQALQQMAESARQAQMNQSIQQALGGTAAGGIDLSALRK